MLGLMMDRPLLISGAIEHAARFHGATEIVSRAADRSLHRTTYEETQARAKKLAQAIDRFGVRAGDRVATMAWNTHRHLEIYYGVSGSGAILHTINPRLFPRQIVYMANHAADRVLFVDLTFLPLLETIWSQLETVELIVVLAEDLPPTTLSNAVDYEAFIGAEDGDYAWPQLDERTASSLCYTSGTTGNPKGVLYSHRSTMLHAMAATGVDLLGISASDTVCPIVPMFHVSAWGIPYTAALAGARLVLPGQHLDGESVCALFRHEGVTMSAGVPTVWLGALDHLERTGGDFGSLRRVAVGGSAAPPAMVAKMAEYGVDLIHAWGMTETSPFGTLARPKWKHAGASEDERRSMRESQGRPPFLVDIRIVGPDGVEAPRDGRAVGELQVRGPWVAAGYFGEPDAAAFQPDGWFGTGDVGTIDADGYLRLTDRVKDVIKSGGEWISSIDLENAAMGHPGVAEAAVIAVPHPKWGERPLLVVVAKPGSVIETSSMLAYLSDKVAKWWLPDDVVTVTEIPHTATGKILKTKLRADFAGYRLPTA